MVFHKELHGRLVDGKECWISTQNQVLLFVVVDDIDKTTLIAISRAAAITGLNVCLIGSAVLHIWISRHSRLASHYPQTFREDSGASVIASLSACRPA